MNNIYLGTIALLFGLCMSSTSFGQTCDPDANQTRRTRISLPNIPNNFTCYLVMKRGWSTYYGTGLLIHPRVILTAGHNIAWYLTTRRPPFVHFRGTREVDAYFGSISVTNFLAHAHIDLKTNQTKFWNKGYYFHKTIAQDFAIVILPDSSIYKSVGGCYKFAPVVPSQVSGPIHITGSPGDKDDGEMWTDSTKNYALNFGNRQIDYDLFTAVRNSGSPIWSRTKAGIQAIGVHSGTGTGDCNGALLITQEVYDQVVSWCRQAGVAL